MCKHVSERAPGVLGAAVHHVPATLLAPSVLQTASNLVPAAGQGPQRYLPR